MFTPEQRLIGRRNFLKAAAALPAVGALAALHQWTGKRVACGIVGTGIEGRVLLESAPTNMLDVLCLCDISPLSQQLGRDVIAKRWGRQLGPQDIVGDDFRRLLDRTDIEAVIIATPLWLHAPMTIAALEAGKHVFCEKTMAYSIEECRQMKAAADRSGKNLQIGHQRFYNPHYQQLYQMHQEGEQGQLGKVYHVRALWHRNTDWRRAYEPAWEQQFGPLLKHFGYDSVDHLINWRLYKKHSKGLMAELASHQIAITNWLAGSLPIAVTASGGLYHYKDGREIEDHMFVIWEYPHDLTVTYSSILTNRADHYYEQVMGTKGTMYLSGETEALFFPEPTAAAPAAAATPAEGEQGDVGASVPTQVQVASATAGVPMMEASESRAADAWGGQSMGLGLGGGNINEAYTLELKGFAQTIRNNYPNLCDAQVGLDAAIAVLSAVESMETGRRIEISPKPLASA